MRELYVPIQISFLSYEVMTDEIEDDDGKKCIKHYVENEVRFLGAEDNGEDFCEQHLSRVDFWTPAMYEQQWREGLARIQTHDKSCLIFNMVPGYIDTWLLYKIDHNVYIQNITFLDEYFTRKKIAYPFITPENCYDYLLEPRMERDANGNGPSEWVVPMLARTIENR
ncbi:hypothetical protein M1466_00170 [Candidatus Dependentiae bacterium]|nr:hypothetical protein [Candidatus Dependentiae bacterium]